MGNETNNLEIDFDGLEGKIVFLKVQPESIRYVGRFKRFIPLDSGITVELTDCISFFDGGPSKVIGEDKEKGEYKIVYPEKWYICESSLAKYKDITRFEVYYKLKNDLREQK